MYEYLESGLDQKIGMYSKSINSEQRRIEKKNRKPVSLYMYKVFIYRMIYY